MGSTPLSGSRAFLSTKPTGRAQLAGCRLVRIGAHSSTRTDKVLNDRTPDLV